MIAGSMFFLSPDKHKTSAQFWSNLDHRRRRWPVACPAAGVAGIGLRPPPPSVQLLRKKCICLYCHYKTKCTSSTRCIVVVRFHKGCLFSDRSLHGYHKYCHIPSPVGVESKFTLVTGSRAYPLLILLPPSLPKLLLLLLLLLYS